MNKNLIVFIICLLGLSTAKAEQITELPENNNSLQAKVKSAKRIIALSPHSVELLFAIGAGDRIVGTVEYADHPEAALKIPRIGNYSGVQIEQVLALKPDLIIAWKSGNKLADLQKMESLGLNLFYSHPKNVSEISRDLIRLGELTGLQKNALKARSDLEQKYQILKKKYQKKSKVKVFYQLWHDPLRTAGADSWIDSLIRDCNGHNLFDDAATAYPIVSMESVLIKDPEVIIIPHHSGDEEAKREIWINWREISAVKNEHLFTINGDILHRFSPRVIQGLEKLCQSIDSARK